MKEFATYWSILDTPSNTIKSETVVLIIGLTAVLVLLILAFNKKRKSLEKKIGIGFSAVFAIISFAIYIHLHFFYNDASTQKLEAMINASKKIEGNVYDFKMTNRSSKGNKELIETFKIDSVEFAYGNALLGQFNSFSEVDNQIIYNGSYLRITYGNESPYGGTYHSILKIEVLKSPSSN